MQRKTLDRITAVQGLIQTYGAMTVRQIYYQLVGTLGLNYRQVAYLCKVGREKRMIPWEGIVDRSRPSYDVGATFEEMGDFLGVIADSFRLDYWADSAHRIEIWTEKDALSQVIYEIAEKYYVTVRVTRGFLSLSNKVRWGGKDIVILYFGDFDPSGLYMDKDLEWGVVFKNFRRIALTREQVDQYNLPSVPVNVKDPRAPAYIRDHGREGWELDALPPNVLKDLVKTTIEEYVDFDLQQKKKEEREIRNEIRDLVE